MRVRLESGIGHPLVALLRRCGGQALPLGGTYELVHPSGVSTAEGDVELVFFVRALEAAAGYAPGTGVAIIGRAPERR
jgi:hypothetical protein